MNSLDFVRGLREICGDIQEDMSYSLKVDDNISARNFVGTDHDAEYPEIVLHPFISAVIKSRTEVYVAQKEGDKPYKRVDVDLYQSRVQADIYAKNLLDMLKVKEVLEQRFKDFFNVEVYAFQEFDGWEVYDTNVWVNRNYDSKRPIFRIEDPNSRLIKQSSIENVVSTSGSWFLDDSGIYVNPLIDTDSLDFFELLSGRVFSNGDTVYDRGFNTYRMSQSRQLGDEDPLIKRWIFQFVISYRKGDEKAQHDAFDQVIINADQK